MISDGVAGLVELGLKVKAKMTVNVSLSVFHDRDRWCADAGIRGP
jgi:hypothetical protein